MDALILFCLVIAVSDGDTIKARCDGKREVVRVRLVGIDAPERGQAFGQRSKQSLAAMCFQRRAEIRVSDTDRYGRTVARVICDGVDANAEQVRRGLAWVYRRYLRDAALFKLEKDARAQRIGLWSERNPMPPWAFRRAAL